MLSIQPQDFLSLTYPADLCISPDAGYCAWLEYTPDLSSNAYAPCLACRPIGGISTSILSCARRPSALAWEDASHLMYSSVSGGSTHLRRLDPVSGEDVPVARIPMPVLSFYPLRDGRVLLLAAGTLRPSSQEEAIILDEIPFWANGRGFTNGQRTRLYVWDHASLSPVSPADAEIGVVSVKDNEILYSVRYHVDKKMKFAALCRYDLVSDTTEQLIPPDTYDIFHVRRIGNQILVCATDMGAWGNVQNPDFFLVKSGNMEKIASPDLGVTNDVTTDARYGSLSQWACGDDCLYFIAVTRSGSRLYRLNLSGSIEPMTEDDGRTIAGICAAGRTIAFVQETPGRSGEVFLFDTSGAHPRLSNCGHTFFSSRSPVPPEHFTFCSGGEEIDGYVIRPAVSDPSLSCPGVLQIHGGPKLAYGSIFHLEMQAMAARGWFVFFCNPRGSDGRGSRFMDLRGQYGTGDYEDLMAFTDHVLKRYPQLDSRRLAVCGGSYGGFMVNWIIGHTKRFCCAVSQRSISNWVSMFCTGDTGYRFVADQLDGTPWSQPQRFFSQSPVQYADKAVTPTLFIHSEQDYRCPVSEGLQMFTALRYFGVESRLCLIRGENHELSRSGRPKQRMKRLEEIFCWLEKHFEQEDDSID